MSVLYVWSPKNAITAVARQTGTPTLNPRRNKQVLQQCQALRLDAGSQISQAELVQVVHTVTLERINF